MSHVSAGVNYAPIRYLPAPIIAAQAAVMHSLNFQDLSMCARRTLFGILTFVNTKNWKKSIFPRRDTLKVAALIGSVTSLYRGLAMLEEKGYITRDQLRRPESGAFYLSPIRLTAKALEIFTFVSEIALDRPAPLKSKTKTQTTPGGATPEITASLEEVKNSPPTEDIHNSPSPILEDVIYKEKEPTKQQSLKRTINEFSGDLSAQPETSNRRQQPNVPTCFNPLLDLCVQDTAILWLMKIAKSTGMRLEDVMISSWKYIKDLKGRAVVAYLKTLLGKPIDFAAQRAQQEDTAALVAEETKMRDWLASLTQRAGWCVLRSGKKVGQLEVYGETVFVRSLTNSCMPLNLTSRDFYSSFVEGEIRLVRPADGFEG